MKKLAPSILSADFSRLGDDIKAVEEAGADYIHIDIMDGHFVPNITVGPLIVETAKTITTLPLDVHLMISDPDCYVQDFIKAGGANGFNILFGDDRGHRRGQMQRFLASRCSYQEAVGTEIIFFLGAGAKHFIKGLIFKFILGCGVSCGWR